MTYNTTKISKELKSWEQVKEMLAGEDLDPQTLFDTLDGETELVEVLCAIKESALEDKAAVKGLDTYISDLQGRKSRIQKTIETKDSIILSTMERADISSLKSSLFTISKRSTPPKVIINDESEIPSSYWKQPDPVLDKKALKDALKDGEVPGAQLSNGGIALSTRIL